MLGFYKLVKTIVEKYPDVLFESCASGGNRVDMGILCYMPQYWCSDNTDSYDRMKIQEGTLSCYPQSTMGAHVSASPNLQTGRKSMIENRFNVACIGAFGYELNPLALSDKEKHEIISQVSQYKKDTEIITEGLYYRLSNPASEPSCAWEYVLQDGSMALVNVVVPLNHGNMPQIYVTPRGLTPGAFYRDVESGKIYAADALMDSGFPLKMPTQDFEGYSFRFERL